MARSSLHLVPAKPYENDRTLTAPGGTDVDIDRLFRRYARYVGSIGLRLLGRRHEVDDLVQDVFLQAHSGLRQLRDAGAIKGWLAQVTVRTAARRLRERRLRGFFALDTATEYDDLADPGASPEMCALLAAVYRALDRLPAKQRLAWTLRHIQGEALAVVAMLCNCSLATAKRRIALAQATLDEVLRDD